MEKLVIKGKKEIRMMLSDSLHETIKTLGVASSPKKVEKALEKTSKKLASKVARQMKKDLKKIRKSDHKAKKSKKSNHQEPVAA